MFLELWVCAMLATPVFVTGVTLLNWINQFRDSGRPVANSVLGWALLFFWSGILLYIAIVVIGVWELV